MCDVNKIDRYISNNNNIIYNILSYYYTLFIFSHDTLDPYQKIVT